MRTMSRYLSDELEEHFIDRRLTEYLGWVDNVFSLSRIKVPAPPVGYYIIGSSEEYKLVFVKKPRLMQRLIAKYILDITWKDYDGN